MPRRRYRMEVDRLREAAGRDTGEVALELDVGEAGGPQGGRAAAKGPRVSGEAAEGGAVGVVRGMVDDI